MEIVKNDLIIRSVDNWFALAPPKKGLAHWVEGRSAYECAQAWCAGSLGGYCERWSKGGKIGLDWADRRSYRSSKLIAA